MQSLPEELIVRILSRVPTRAAMRFRLVSKAWDELISDPFFARIHSRAPISGFFSVRCLGRHGQDLNDGHVPSFTSFTGDGGGGIPAMARDLLSEGFVAEGSCNGLICFGKDGRLVICDPITQTSATIDDSIKHLPVPPQSYLINVQLLYDPTVSTDFKIVKIWLLLLKGYVVFHVFSSRDGSWRESSKHAPFETMGCRIVASSSVGEEGSVCWLETCGNYGCMKVYDIGADSISEMPIPPLEVRKRRRDQTGFMGALLPSVSGGRVYLMREVQNKLQLWRLEGKERRWVLEFEGSKTNLKGIEVSPEIHPLAYDAEERKMIMDARHGTVESYHLPSSKMEVIARGVDWSASRWIVPHWNKPAPFRICAGASVQS